MAVAGRLLFPMAPIRARRLVLGLSLSGGRVGTGGGTYPLVAILYIIIIIDLAQLM